LSHVLSEEARSDVAAAWVAGVAWMSLHAGAPGSAGTNELQDAPYRRQRVQLRREGPNFVGAQDVRFVVPALSHPPRWLGYWTAERGGRFRGAAEIVADTGDTEPYEAGDVFLVPGEAILVSAL
jgi:hypothetical protein